MEKGHTIPVLDHGYVKLVNWMGSDEDVIDAARMSTDGGFVSWEPYEGHPRGDSGLLEYLYKNQHMTPYEMGDLIVEVQAPIFVFREWHRHRTQSYNEFSARYSQMPNLHYLPEPSRIQRQATANKQSSAEPLPENIARGIITELDNAQQDIYGQYEAHLDEGVAKEIARINTPVSRYSKMRAKSSLRNWLAFLALRMPKDAQYEIRQYANAIAELIKALWPRTYALFEEYTLYAMRFSRTEKESLKRVLTGLLETSAGSNEDREQARKLLAKLSA